MPASRGASDDGAGVVTLLETARALLSMDNLDNDVILLFTDGEENGLLGARAFVTLHPWAQDVGIFFNFEARGHEGASTMFRTSPHNGKLIPGFAESVTRPITNSLVSTLARFLPNDSDFTVLTSAEQYWPRTEVVFAKTPTMPVFFSRSMPVWQGTAPHNIYPAPHLEVLLDEVDTVHNLRTLKLKISSRRKADCIAVWEESPSIVRAISVNGRKVVRSEARFSEAVDKLVIDAMLGQPLRYWEVHYCNIPESGLIIDAKRDITSTAMRLRVVDDAHETFLPFSNRAANTMPTPWGDRSMVSKLFTL